MRLSTRCPNLALSTSICRQLLSGCGRSFGPRKARLNDDYRRYAVGSCPARTFQDETDGRSATSLDWFKKAELHERRDSVIETDFGDDLSVLNTQDGRAGEMHL